jgi:putative tricarboxylic transport membrane protein
MIDFHALVGSIHLLSSSWEPWLVVIPGLLIGLFFHAVPGLTTSMAIALFLPVIPYMSFLSALVFMTAMYTGSLFGVAIPAILLNIPGSPAAVATTFDGFPLAQQGRHDEALGYALTASIVGQALSYIVLLILVVPISQAVIKLGPPELAILALWGLTLIASLRGRYVFRGLLAGIFGLLIGTIGFSARGNIRGTMGIEVLLDGVPVVPAIIGLFAASELFNLATRDYIIGDMTGRQVSIRRILHGVAKTFSYPGVLLRGSVIGLAIGMVPGGHAVANLLSYSEAKRTAKDPSQFGHGDPRGVIAAESANASSECGSMATLLSLGIPTGGATAIMLTAFDMNNITGGPQFMSEHKDLVYAVILANLIQVVVLFFVGLGFVFVASYVIKVPLRMLIGMVLSLSVIGAYLLSSSMAGPVTIFVFAVIGWTLRHFEYPVAATVVGLLLARMTEGAMLRTYQMSGGDPTYLLHRPIALVLLVLLIFSLVITPLSARLKRRVNRPDTA